MSGYENAPATALVASQCVACGRPLVDAVSVEAGMGPDCREKYGYNEAVDVSAEARADVNAKVHALAAGKLPPAEQIGHLLIIRAHGFAKLADRLEERLAVVLVEQLDAATIAISAPYDEAFTAALKAATPWRRWDKEAKRWVVPATQQVKNALFAVMRRHFGGGIGRGPQGLFALA